MIANDPHGVSGSASYGYDPVGNRLNRSSSIAPVSSQSSSYDANDRLTSDGYDNNGNTTTANGNSYAFDYENHLTSLNGSSVRYTYDGDGNRVAKTVGGVTTSYLVDTNNPTGYAQVVDELQGGAVVRSFTYGHERIAQRIVGSSLSFYQYDGHGSVRQLTNASGTITDAYDYDAFGNLIYRSGTTPNDYLYCGEQFDANLGFYNLRARYMNPSNGRFWTMDSFMGAPNDPLTLHKYLYARSNPVSNVDPSGLASLAEEEIVMAESSILDSMSAIGQAVLRRLVANRLTVGAAGALTRLFSNPETLQELEEDGEEGIVKIQETFSRFEGTVTEAESEASSLWNNFDQLKNALNRLFTGIRSPNPPNIQYHHLVEQGGENAQTFSPQAINSLANVVPTPTGIHQTISSFYSSAPSWLPQGMTTVRMWMQTQSFEVQWRAGLEVWKQAMMGGPITWGP